MARFASEGLGGKLVRRLVPVSVVLPLGVGGLLIAGERAQFIGMEFGLAVFASAVIGITVALVLATGRIIDRSDAERDATMAALKAAEARLLDALANLRLIAWNNSVTRDASGTVAGTLSIGEDITERRAAEETLRASEQRFRSLFESMTEGFAHCRVLFEDGEPVDFVYLDVNAAFEVQTGLKNVVGRRISEVIPGIRQADPELFARYGRVALTGTPERFEIYVSALGTWFAISVYCPQPEHFVAVFDVITERKRAEDELRQREYWLQQAQRVGRAGYYVLDVAAGTWTSSAELDVVFGIDATFERSVAGWAGLVHPEDRDAMVRYFREEVIGRRLPFDRKYRIVHPSDGAVRWLWGRGELALDPGGMPIRMFGTIQDITEAHVAQEALLESERKYRTLVEGLPVGLYRSSPDGRLLAVNRAWLNLMGYDSEEQALQLRMARDIYVDPALRPRLVEQVSAEPGGTSFEARWKRRDGTPIDVRVTARPVRDADGKAIAFESAVEDVTQRRILEEQLRQAQKIEAVGQLAGGVAHDFNNLLTTIVTSADLLSDLAPAGSEAAEDVAAIKHAAQRGAELTKKLLAFGRKQRLELRTVDLRGPNPDEPDGERPRCDAERRGPEHSDRPGDTRRGVLRHPRLGGAGRFCSALGERHR